MLPSEILEDIFAYLSRDALDHCQIICLKWNKVIETSKRLIQRRIVSFKHGYPYDEDIPNEFSYDRFRVELESSTGKTFHIEDDPNQQELPASRVFNNIIIDELSNGDIGLYNIDRIEKEYMKIFKLAGVRIIVKRVYLEAMNFTEEALRGNIIKRFQDLLTKYIDVNEIRMDVYCMKHTHDYINDEEVLFNQEFWKSFGNFGKRTEFNLSYHSHILPIDFSNDTFKEFISGKYMEHPKLNELELYLEKIEAHVIVPLIVEAFCNTDEPQKFFKSIKTLRSNNSMKFLAKSGFVCEDRDPEKYRLSHPKLKWALEATQPPDKDRFSKHFKHLKFKSIEL